jgi:hypothetical protein
LLHVSRNEIGLGLQDADALARAVEEQRVAKAQRQLAGWLI